MGKTVSRNDPCPCGSGKKYKQCCLGKPPPAVRRRRLAVPLLVAVVGVAAGVALGFTRGVATGLGAGGAALVFAGLILVIRDPPPPKSGGRDGASINFGT